MIHNYYIINKSKKIKSPLSEAFSFPSFLSQHSHIPKFFLDRANQFKIELISRMSARRIKMSHYDCPVSSILAPFHMEIDQFETVRVTHCSPCSLYHAFNQRPRAPVAGTVSLLFPTEYLAQCLTHSRNSRMI